MNESDSKNSSVSDTISEQASNRQMVGVRFQRAGKLYHFAADAEIDVSVDDWVVVETVYGDQVGRVSKVETDNVQGQNLRDLREVLRLATSLDMARYQLMQERAERMVEVAREEIKSLSLELRIVSAELTLDGRSSLVLCSGNLSKKDASALRRRLSSRMSCRVELRTVGPRDQAKAQGGFGVCGEQRCCDRFLCDFQAVSIRMAKDQAISMAPTDITGMCGRLRCCLAYEHQVYKDASRGFPKRKARVMTDRGLGRVIDWDILKGVVVVEIPPTGPRRDRERFRYEVDEVEVVKRKN